MRLASAFFTLGDGVSFGVHMLSSVGVSDLEDFGRFSRADVKYVFFYWRVDALSMQRNDVALPIILHVWEKLSSWANSDQEKQMIFC